MSAQKQYELVYIAAPESTEEQLAELHTQVAGIVTRLGGAIDRDRKLGPAAAGLSDRAAQGRHLRPRGHLRRRRCSSRNSIAG